MKYLFCTIILLASFNNIQAQIVANGSFENSSINPGLFAQLPDGSTVIDDWLVVKSIDYIGTLWTHSDGNKSLNASDIGAITQTFITETGES